MFCAKTGKLNLFVVIDLDTLKDSPYENMFEILEKDIFEAMLHALRQEKKS